MVASLKRRHFEIQETDVRRDYFEVVFTKEKDGICKERWHPAATFLSSVRAHSLWRKKPELRPISNQAVVSQGRYWNTTRNGWIFRWVFHIFGVKFDKEVTPVPSGLCFAKTWKCVWTTFHFLLIFFGILNTMVETLLQRHLHNGWHQTRGSSKKYVAVEKQR